MKIVEFAENNPAVPGEHGEGIDVARVEAKKHVIALAVFPGSRCPYLVKINGKEYQSMGTADEAGDYFDKVLRKLEKA